MMSLLIITKINVSNVWETTDLSIEDVFMHQFLTQNPSNIFKRKTHFVLVGITVNATNVCLEHIFLQEKYANLSIHSAQFSTMQDKFATRVIRDMRLGRADVSLFDTLYCTFLVQS